MASKNPNPKSICPLTQSQVVRENAAKDVESIRDAFPRGIAAPALRALFAANLVNLEALTKISEAEISQLHGMGPKAIATLKAALKEKGLSFAK